MSNLIVPVSAVVACSNVIRAARHTLPQVIHQQPLTQLLSNRSTNFTRVLAIQVFENGEQKQDTTIEDVLCIGSFLQFGDCNQRYRYFCCTQGKMFCHVIRWPTKSVPQNAPRCYPREMPFQGLVFRYVSTPLTTPSRAGLSKAAPT